jgi:elongation of very long chain fatty acids protein 6
MVHVSVLFMTLRRYHHATVLLATWFGHVTFTPGLPFTSMNYSIHAVMYMYFFLGAIGRVPRWFNPKWLTMAQISQMFVGIYVTTVTTYYKYFTVESCHVDDRMILCFLFMYGTYAFLFVQFFMKRFARRDKKRVSDSKATSADAPLELKKAQ